MVVHIRSTILGAFVTTLALLLAWSLQSRGAAQPILDRSIVVHEEEVRLTALENSLKDLRQDLRNHVELPRSDSGSAGGATAAPTPAVVRSPEWDGDAVQPQVLALLRIIWDASKDDGYGLNAVLRRSGKYPTDKGVIEVYLSA